MTTVTWVLNPEGYHEISSPEHLIQLMHNGAKYTNEGDTPSSFNFNVKFLQTVDIDLANYHEDIKPIGGSPHYDGGNHAIANWEYSRDGNAGFFEFFGGEFKNARLTGVWKLSGSAIKGFAVGYLYFGKIDNITTHFEEGTEITGATTAGGLVGYGSSNDPSQGISGCTLGGTLALSAADNIGGILGYSDACNMTFCANYATFPGGLRPTTFPSYAGGIIGRGRNTPVNLHNLINGMKGDIGDDTTYMSGGIMAQGSGIDNTITRFDTFVNVMVGNITTTGTSSAATCGGIFGLVGNAVTTKAVNYMTGNISGNEAKTGGIVGQTSAHATNSIIAMNGHVTGDAVAGTFTTVPEMSAVVNTDFGLTFSRNSFPASTADTLVDFVTDDVFTLLPYLPISGTSQAGTAISFDPSFGNLSGLDPASPYAKYTTLTIHTSPAIQYPYPINLGFSDTNTTKYLTYASLLPHKTTLYVDDAITGPFTGVETLDSIFNLSESVLLKGMQWTQNGSGEYEISTPQQLVQIMSNGTVYDEIGAPPAYMTASFAQTADIDLVGYGAAIEPIGSALTPFTGAYTGSMHTISNWKYDRGTAEDGTGIDMGLFGRIDGGTVSSLKLTGVWTLAGSCEAHGFVAGKLVGTTCQLSDIEADFEEGTSLSSGHTASSSTCGLLVGAAEGDCTVTGIQIRGKVAYQGSDSVLGGVIGSVSGASSLSGVENYLNLSTDLGGSDTVTGGIVGMIGDGVLNAHNLSNGLSGTITGSRCGGVAGSCANGTAMTRADTWANAMTGNIVGSVCAGGIVGEFEAVGAQVTTLSKVTNYMSGDITSTASGGVIGKTVDSSSGTAPPITCNNSVVAMHGTVGDTAVGDSSGHPVDMIINVNSDFGIAFTTNTHGTDSETNPVTGFETFSSFPLPFLSMIGSTNLKNLFPNVAGVAETSPLFGYDVVVIHSHSTIYAPFLVEFDFVPDGTRYIAYANVTKSELYVDPALTVTSSTALYTMDYDGKSKFGMLPPIEYSRVAFKELRSTRSAHRQHSFTDYTESLIMVGRNQDHAGGINSDLNDSGLPLYWVGRSRGMVYNPNDDHVYYATDNNRIKKIKADTTGHVDVHYDASYFTIVGDSSKRYMFGSRNSGGTHQVYRMDIDATNMVTANVTDLIGSNIAVNGFTSNPDDERVYFSDGTTVYSLSWALDDLQTMPIELISDRTSIWYHQGRIYFGNRDPITGAQNDNIYVYDIARGGFHVFEGLSIDIKDSYIGQHYLYVDANTKRLLITATNGNGSYVATNFDVHTDYVTVDQQFTDGYTFSWTPIEGATSYQVDINGVTVTTTSDTAYTSRGHANRTLLFIVLSYSTDDTTYVAYRYGNRSLTVRAQFWETFLPQNFPAGEFPALQHRSATWADPYENPNTALFIDKGATMYTLDVIARTFTSVPTSGINQLDRSPTTKDIIAYGNHSNLYNVGENATHIRNNTMPAPFYTHSTSMKAIHCSYSGLIYFADGDNKIWSVGLDGANPQLIVTTSLCNYLSTDTHSPEKLVYQDYRTLKYLNLSTNTTTDLLIDSNLQYASDLYVSNGVAYVSAGYLWRVSLDDETVRDKLETGGWYGVSLLVDHSQNNVLVFDYRIGTSDSNLMKKLHDDTHNVGSLPADASSMVVAVTPLGMRASWSPIPGATSYKLGISAGADGENAVAVLYTTSETSQLYYTHTLAPETTHTVYLMYDTSTETDVASSSRTITIPAASSDPADYSKEFFRGRGSRFDLTKVTNVDLGPVMNTLFQSGDDVQVRLKRGKRFPKARFVNQGDTVDVQKVEAVLLPFDETAGSSQNIGLRLSDGSTFSVLYDETADTIAIDSTVYSVGDYTVIDNMKVSVHAS